MYKPIDPPADQSLLVPAEHIPAMLGHPGMNRGTVHKLRRLGQWPRLMFIGGRLFAKRSDVLEFIERQLASYDEQHAKHQAHGRKAIHTRWRKAEQEPVP